MKLDLVKEEGSVFSSKMTQKEEGKAQKEGLTKQEGSGQNRAFLSLQLADGSAKKSACSPFPPFGLVIWKRSSPSVLQSVEVALLIL